MNVVYFSQPFFADCDFPLIKEMQERGINVRYYMPIGYGFKNSSILEFETPICKWGIYKASKIKVMEKYKDCLDLNKLYFICGRNIKWWPMSWLLWFMVYLHIIFFKTNIVHITWQLHGLEYLLFHLPLVSKKIMTVHDPIQHLGERQEKARLKSFKWANTFLLLNSQQVDVFSKTYDIPKDEIYVSKLGVYDSIKYLHISPRKAKTPYILFFGHILPYKGIEYLLDAMLKVHEECKNINLLIAGFGHIYFDMSKYSNKDYIRFEHRYIGISELVGMIKESLFVVCPYKEATQSGVVQTSFALETPIVATSVGALPEMIKNDVYGKIVPPCNSDALADAMLELIKNTEKLNILKSNIRTQWVSSMSWLPIVDDYFEMYNA